MQDPGPWMRDPASCILDPALGSWILGPGCKIQDLGRRILDPGSRLQDPGPWTLDPSSWIQDQGSRAVMFKNMFKIVFEWVFLNTAREHCS